LMRRHAIVLEYMKTVERHYWSGQDYHSGCKRLWSWDLESD
jgi:hypothetical protein